MNSFFKKAHRSMKLFSRFLDFYLWLLFDPFKFNKIKENKIKKVLIVNLAFIGDVLATTPLIKALKNKFGSVSIMILPTCKEVIIGNPDINKILFYHNEFFKDLKLLKREKFDLVAIIYPGSFKVSIMCLLAGIPYRIGCEPVGVFQGKGFFLNKKVKPSFKEKHEVENFLDISRLVNADNTQPKIEFYFSKQEELFANKFLRKNKVKKFVIIHPGKRGKFYSEYSYSLENLAKIADYLVEKYKVKVMITGAKGEEKIAEEIITNMKNKKQAIIAAGKLNLKQSAVLLKKAELLISIDTGVVHIASSFNKRIIVLNVKYPKTWYPYTDKNNYKILQNPSIKEIIFSIKQLLK
ncbi:MAG: glycosyltransferase family 9 protein [Nanoarchaeota archaeon]|nr:glycosyltransferase family 9 protein [Nanoarchaeota archaeon]